jgi:hypothetical protein
MINTIDKPELYDQSRGYDDETGIRFRPGLSDLEKKRATIIYRLFNELWGLCIVTGDPGTGKDAFLNYITYKIKTWFPHKRILRDERPRELYGSYDGVFDEEIIYNDIKSMKRISKGEKLSEEELQSQEKAIDDWLKGAGEVKLKNSVLYLTEYWKYCYNRENTSPMNKTMGGIHKVARHLDCLVFGSVQNPLELDRYTSLPWVNWQVICTKSSANITGFTYFVYKVKYDKRKHVLNPQGTPFPIPVDMGLPRSELGDGKIIIKRRDYIPENEEERVVLEVIKAGVNIYEDIVSILTQESEMEENEISDTIKKLGLKLPGFRPKMVLDYPCYFKLYNSKSAVALNTSIRFEDK